MSWLLIITLTSVFSVAQYSTKEGCEAAKKILTDANYYQVKVIQCIPVEKVIH